VLLLPTKEDLLYSLTIRELRELARQYDVSLVKKSSLLGILDLSRRATRKDDIVDVLMRSRRISKKVVQDFKLREKRTPRIEDQIVDEDELDETLISIEHILNNMYKDELVEACEEFDINSKGRKSAIVKRLLDHIEDDVSKVEQVLKDWYGVEDLKDFLRDYGLPVSGRKSELIERVLDNLLIEYEIPQIVESKPTLTPIQKAVLRIERKEKRISLDEEFRQLVRVIASWTPSIKWRSESGYRADLDGYLRGIGYNTHLSDNPKRSDILVNEKYPIELKHKPRKPEYQRLFGQMDEYVNEYGVAIAVICSIRTQEQFWDFKNRMTKLHGENAVVMNK